MSSLWSVRIERDDPLHLRQLFTLGPSNADHWIGLRCGVGVFVPLAVLLLLNRIDLAVFVIFGAFTNVFGRVPNHLDRLIAQLKVGSTFWLLMVVATLVSGVLPHGTPSAIWVKVLLTSVVAGGAALWATWQHIRPAGSLFHVFAFAALLSAPPSSSLDAAGWRAVIFEAGVHFLASLMAGLLIVPIAAALGLGHHYWR